MARKKAKPGHNGGVQQELAPQPAPSGPFDQLEDGGATQPLVTAHQHDYGPRVPPAQIKIGQLAYQAGVGMLNHATFPPGESGDFHASMALPLMQGLLDELGEEASTMTRMLVQMAANSFSDWAYTTGTLRLFEDQAVNGGDAKLVERLQRRNEQAFKRAMTCLEMLQRPNPRNLKVDISQAGNVNFGRQSVSQSTQGTDKPETGAK